MTIGFRKGLKPLFIKRLALLMSICYLVNPLQPQIKTIFHTVSHAIEVPNFVMSHNSNSLNNEFHGHQEHRTHTMQHDHSIMDLIDSVFTAFNENNDSEDSILFKIKMDKHITTYEFELIEGLKIKVLPNFWALEKKQKSGFFQNIKKPPQYFLS